MDGTAANSAQDIRAAIEHGPMTAFQILAVGICWTINMLDGVDILAISFTAPEISAEWGVTPAALGVVFSAGFFGMVTGSLVLAPIGDYVGRRWTILGGLVVITASMLATAFVQSTPALVAARAATGTGIGVILASLTTVVAEYTSNKHRSFAISFMHMGYPVGAVLSGLIAVYLIGAFGWRAVFIFGGVASAVMIPLVFVFLPESVSFLCDKQPQGALQRLNRILKRMGRPAIAAMPPKPEKSAGASISVVELFTPAYFLPTLALWISFFLCMMALYFLLSWTPTVVVDSGLTADQGRLAGVLMNVGGAFLMFMIGWLSVRFDLTRLIQTYLILSAICIMIFAAAPLPTFLLMVFAALTGFEMSGLVGLYSVAARLYPTHMRNTGVGWAIGVGRWGAVFAPMAAGWMIAAGLERWSYFLALAAVPAFIAALVVPFIRKRA